MALFCFAQKTKIQTIDINATKETKVLNANLKKLSKKYILFGICQKGFPTKNERLITNN